MRIIAGKYRGRKLAEPKDMAVRPTTGKMRERIFSMMQHNRYPNLAGAWVMDVFAGTGALGLEALSRGASHVTFVEKSLSSLAVLKKNIAAMGVEAEVDIIERRATDIPTAHKACDFIFMDPPYGKGLVQPALDSLLERNWLKQKGIIICEMHSKDAFSIPDAFVLLDERMQGIQRVVFLGVK